MMPFVRALAGAAAAPYRAAGPFAWHFARGKLGGDPVFAGVLAHGLIPDNARMLDIGCGQGLLAAWLLSARASYDNDKSRWPLQWPPPPRSRDIRGIELMPRQAQRAQRALGGAATIIAGDMRDTDFGKADVVVIFDVLHYISIAEQDALLHRVRDALAPRGTLLLRIGDAAAGLRFLYGVWVDRLVRVAQGQRHSRLQGRPLAAWCARLGELGFAVETLPMSHSTPFANVLLVAKLGQNSDVRPARAAHSKKFV